MCCPSRLDDALEGYHLWKSKAEGHSACDYSFHMAVTKFEEQTEAQLREIIKDGIASFKIFLAYKNFFGVDDGEIRSAAREHALNHRSREPAPTDSLDTPDARIGLGQFANLGGRAVGRIVVNIDNLPFDPVEGGMESLDQWLYIVYLVETRHNDSQFNRRHPRQLVRENIQILVLKAQRSDSNFWRTTSRNALICPHCAQNASHNPHDNHLAVAP